MQQLLIPRLRISPDAVIFVKTFPYRGVNYWMVKALIDEEFYEMQPIRAR